LNVKAPTTPMVPMSAAANIGPQSLAMLNWTELSAMARSSSARGTRLGTTERKTGPLRAQTIPSRNVKTITTQGVARPTNAAAARPAPSTQADAWRVINQTFRLTRSDITPASRASKRTGQKSANCKTSTRRPWWGLPTVWVVTAQLWAAFSVQLPVLEMQAPTQKIKNGRCRKTCRGFTIREGGEPLALSNIKHSYQFRRPRKSDLPAHPKTSQQGDFKGMLTEATRYFPAGR